MKVANVEDLYVVPKNADETARVKPPRTSRPERKKILKQNSPDASYEMILRDQGPQETVNDSFKLKPKRKKNYIRPQHKSEAKCDYSQMNKLLHTTKRARGDCVGAGDSICDVSEEHMIGNKVSGLTRSMRQPSYLQPTLSYRMKCVEKSKSGYGDGNQKIPFVVGNFRSKSHNVGSKIQETLSLIKGAPKQLLEKTRQGKDELGNMIRCMTAFQPSLVRSQGTIKPPSTAFVQCSRSTVSMVDSARPLDIKHHQFRTVLMKLQDEYARMNDKYQKLCKLAEEHASKGSAQNSLHACSPHVTQQVRNLEEHLNAKEIEINAFVSLYNEVIHLKKKLSKMNVESDGNDESLQTTTTSGRCKTSANRSKKK